MMDTTITTLSTIFQAIGCLAVYLVAAFVVGSILGRFLHHRLGSDE